MAMQDLIMPKMGESVVEATIIKWLKKEGDPVKMDETILEIATDKVDSEIPSPFDGFLGKTFFAEGQVVKVGEVIAHINSSKSDASQTSPVPTKQNTEVHVKEHAAQSAVFTPAGAEQKATLIKNISGGRFYSPLVKNIARQEGISIQELDQVSGSGREGRVTKTDILNYLPQRQKNGTHHSETAIKNNEIEIPAVHISKPSVSVNGGDEIIEMDRMRKLIADHMVMSKYVSPHVTSFVEADVTNMVLWREKIKSAFEKREGEKITFTPLFVEAVARAIKEFPMINVSVDGHKIIRRKQINIGMAAALPSGNLIVPVIRDADGKNLVGLTKAVNDLANRARMNKLLPDEIQGGTFTLTNVGGFGNLMGTPIINQPQVAILATGSIKKKPAVIETPQGDLIGIRHMMFLSLSYDHRVVDGSLGGSFLKRIADHLENFDLNRVF